MKNINISYQEELNFKWFFKCPLQQKDDYNKF